MWPYLGLAGMHLVTAVSLVVCMLISQHSLGVYVGLTVQLGKLVTVKQVMHLLDEPLDWVVQRSGDCWVS